MAIKAVQQGSNFFNFDDAKYKIITPGTNDNAVQIIRIADNESVVTFLGNGLAIWDILPLDSKRVKANDGTYKITLD